MKLFFSNAGIEFPKIASGAVSARHLMTFWAPKMHRDFIISKLQEQEIGVTVNYRAVHLLKYYRDNFGYLPGDFPVAEVIGDRTISLPLYPGLSNDQVEFVGNSVVEIISNLK